MRKKRGHADDTKLVDAGRPPASAAYPVNPPVTRASTILFDTYKDFQEGARNIVYGRFGTDTHRALEAAVTDLEGGVRTHLTPSGLSAVTASILAFVKAGDHVLISDGVYDPTRGFCERFLKRFGVTPDYYDPQIGAAIADKITPATKAIVAESPSSLTFEVQDLPAIAAAARKADVKLIVDNTWGAGYFLKPIALGAHVSLQAGTKYLVGHSDALIGAITCADEVCAEAVTQSLRQLGSSVSADDAALALRGLRTLSVRLKRHEQTGLALAEWLAARPEVSRVLHPARPGAPGHDIWRRDFTGASGLFSIVLAPVPEVALEAFFNAMTLFGMGFSWGGYESLAIPSRPGKWRTATVWADPGPVVRIHAGLEDPGDLIEDLDQAFAAMAARQ